MKQYTRLALCTYAIDSESSKGRSSPCSSFFLSFFSSCVYSVERRALAKKTNFIERKNLTIKCQLVHSFAIQLLFFFLLHFCSSSLPFLPSTGFFVCSLPASFSILSPRIIFTSVINKSALWTFFCELCCCMTMPMLLLDARKEMS